MKLNESGAHELAQARRKKLERAWKSKYNSNASGS